MAELSTLFAIALKTSILMAVVGLAAAALAKESAAYRHLVWTAALALAVLMPLAILYLPVQLLVPVWWPVPETFAAPHEAASAIAGPAAADWSTYVWPVLFAVWAAGAAALLLRDATAHAGLLRWRRRARPLASPVWIATFERLAHTHPFPRGLVVLESRDIAGPCTWGVAGPILLLPLAGEAWSESERQHALVHEFAHIRRHDYLSALIARLCRAVHWYNPLVWFAAAQVKRLQEQACDDAVLRHGGRPSEYAQLLLNIAEHSPGPARVAMGMAGRSHLRGRVVAILGGPRIARVEPGALVIMGVLLALSCLMFFIATAAAAPPEASTHRHWAALSAAAANAPPPTSTDPSETEDVAPVLVAVNVARPHGADEEDTASSEGTTEVDVADEGENDNATDATDADVSDSEDVADAGEDENVDVTVNVSDEETAADAEEPEEPDSFDDMSGMDSVPAVPVVPEVPPEPPMPRLAHPPRPPHAVVAMPAVSAIPAMPAHPPHPMHPPAPNVMPAPPAPLTPPTPPTPPDRTE